MPLVTFEGIDGAGKTSQIEMTRAFMERNGRTVHVFKEPGGTVAGEMARDILLRTDEDIHPLAQLMLFQFSRAQLVNTVVRPLLDKGETVFLDRYAASTIAYQGIGQGLGKLKCWDAFMIATNALLPDMELYLDVDLVHAYARMEGDSKKFDNFEADRAFMQKVKAGYDDWYRAHCPYPYTRINANNGENDVNTQILKAIWSDSEIIP